MSVAPLSGLLSHLEKLLALQIDGLQLSLIHLKAASSSERPAVDIQEAVRFHHQQCWELVKAWSDIPELAELLPMLLQEIQSESPVLDSWTDIQTVLSEQRALLTHLTGLLTLRMRQQQVGAIDEGEQPPPQRRTTVSATSQRPVEPDVPLLAPVLTLELGVGLIDGAYVENITRRIQNMRRSLRGDMGVVFPPVQIIDNLHLPEGGYVIRLHGELLAEGCIVPGKVLAICPSGVPASLSTAPTTDPSFGLPAAWLDPNVQQQAAEDGVTVVDDITVVMTHFGEMVQRHLHEVFGYSALDSMLAALEQQTPRLVQALQRQNRSDAEILHVFRALLQEGIPIRAGEKIIEVCVAHPKAPPPFLVAACRVRLARTICEMHSGEGGRLRMLMLSPNLLAQLRPASIDWEDPSLALTRAAMHALILKLRERVEQWPISEQSPVLLVPDRWTRSVLAAALRTAMPGLVLLCSEEIPADWPSSFLKPMISLSDRDHP